MQSHKSAFFAVSAVMMLLAFTSIARAGSFSSVIVYGDSLSDNGNLYAAIGQPSAPNWNGRDSNGPVAVEQLAAMLGAPLHDFAWDGATSGIGNHRDGGTQTSFGTHGLPGMIPELNSSSSALLLASPIVPSSLFVVWGGFNDFRTGGSATQAVTDIDSIVSSLQADGAQHILVPGMANMGLTPAYYGDPAATAFSLEFNSLLKASLPTGAIYFNFFGLVNEVVNDPAAFGLTDVTDPCFNGVTVCSDPNQYLFWDGLHPTTAADTIIATDIAAGIPAPIPEPTTLLMLGTFLTLGTGLGGVAGVLRRRRAV